MRWQIEPMESWPYPETVGRKVSPFRAKFDATLKLLTDELDHLNVVGAVAVRVVTDDADVRQDGMLRARAVVRHPGVVLSFKSAKHGALTYPCDTFVAHYYGENWQTNLRAIALGLEKLRALDRYGIAGRGEQYAGWRAIEGSSAGPFATTAEALTWLRTFTRAVHPFELTENDVSGLLRLAAKKAHPDVGGDRSDWDRVDAARQLLQRAGVIS